MQVLLSAGADVHGHGEEDETPLHLAARNDHLDVAEALLRAEADPSEFDEGGRTPAALARSDEMRSLLERYRGNPRRPW